MKMTKYWAKKTFAAKRKKKNALVIFVRKKTRNLFVICNMILLIKRIKSKYVLVFHKQHKLFAKACQAEVMDRACRKCGILFYFLQNFIFPLVLLYFERSPIFSPYHNPSFRGIPC